MEKLIKTTAIFDCLLLDYKHYDITESELICICQLKVYDDYLIDFILFMEETKCSKQVISSLVAKSKIKVVEVDGVAMISLEPIYEQLLSASKPEDVDNNLNKEQIERLSHLFNRSFQPHEIELINTWLQAGNDFKQIEEACYIALTKGVSNLNYIAKIIENAKPAQTVSESPITRNWNF